jgi:hypothetical protein
VRYETCPMEAAMKRACRSVPVFFARARVRAFRRALVLGAILALLVTRPAHARDQLEIPVSCGSYDELERELAALRPARDLTWQRPSVRITKLDSAYLLEVELPDETRTLRDPDCRSLFRAAVLISALGSEGAPPALADASQPDDQPAQSSHDRTRDPNASDSAPPSKVGETSGRARLALSAPELPGERARAAFSLAAGAAYGAVPAVGFVASAGLEGGRRRWSLRVLAHYLAPRSERSDVAPRVGVRVDGVGAGLELEWRIARWLRAGAGGQLFLLRGRGLDVLRARSDWTTLGALHASVALGLYERGRFGLSLPVRVLYAPQPSRFVVDGRGTVYTAASLGFHAGLSLSWRFL